MGTGDEREAALSSPSRDLKEAVRELVEERLGDPHPAVELWISFHEGGLEEAETDRLQDHLANCPECADLVLDLGTFERPEGLGETTDLEARSAWRRVLARPREHRRASAAVAAAALVAALVTGGWATYERSRALDLERSLAEFSKPMPNPDLVDLFSGEQERGNSQVSELPTVTAAEGSLVVLSLHLRDPQAGTDYSIEIAAENGEPIWSGGPVRSRAFDNLTLALSGRFLPSGVYEVRVYRRNEGGPELVERYRFRFQGR
ncbi:MAG: zf-HC2 domain-containing protein [Deltaproteobacteria bacterium]|nr:zf-HC2 domain-containing protein [Deltaproteobacteria bacterium]